MHARVSFACFARLVWSLLLAALLPTAVLGQEAPTDGGNAVASDSQDVALQIDALLREGQTLESQRNWDAALSHYEQARKRFPDEPQIEQRFRLTRLHFDLGRRYADASFRQSLVDLSYHDCLELYGEVAAKIQTHYVDEPDWRRLADRGTTALEVALTDDVYLDRYLSRVPDEQINRFRTELRDAMSQRLVRSRHEAKDAVNYAAWLAQRRLGLPPAAVILEYVCGAANMLDDYTSFLSKGEYDELQSQIRGNFVGMGIELKPHDQGLLILRVIPGSPAQRSGVRDGDVIVAVEGRSAKDLGSDAAADMLQGPEGSTVRVTLESQGQRRTLAVRREKVEVPSVDEVKMLDAASGIAYLRLSSFQETTTRELNAALWKLHKAGMKSLIIDLRGNPGGLLDESVRVADKFIDQGVVVTTKGRHILEDRVERAEQQGTWYVPLVVLIDGDSASASEIFAGAIRDHERGTIVGTRSYGKGSVQGIFSLTTGGMGIRLTTAKFYSPEGKPYSKVGVSPDVEVTIAARVGEDGTVSEPGGRDPFISAALQVARDNIARRPLRRAG